MNAMKLKLIFSSFLLAALTFTCGAQFVNVLPEFGINPIDSSSFYGSAISFADFNGDGWDDLSIGLKDEAPKFYMNNEGQGFTEQNFDVLSHGQSEINMILWADYDNDGDRDLIISTEFDNIYFYENNGSLQLSEVTTEKGLDVTSVENYGLSWGDFNNDGLLDLYLARYNTNDFPGIENENILFKQLSDHSFENISVTAGVNDGEQESFNSIFWDFNQDGHQDLFVINDRANTSNSLYKNLGNETFELHSSSVGLNQLFNAMSINLGDYDNDEDFDLFISNTNQGCYLNRNNGDETFTNIGSIAGVKGNSTCWGAVWTDYDNNGLLDMYNATAPLNLDLNLSYFYEQNESGTFDNRTALLGFGDDDDANYAVAQGDFDRDGREDILVGSKGVPSKLYRNETPQALNNHWISCSFEGTISNREAIGTLLKVYCDADVFSRYTLCGESFISQNSYNKHVGLGTHELIDSLAIKWPRGLVEMHYNLPVDSFFHFIEGQTIAPNIQLEDTLLVCPGESLLLEIPQEEFSSILWSDEDDNFIREFEILGDYYATLTHNSGIIVQTDTFTLAEHQPIFPELVNTNPSCFGDNDGSLEIVNSQELENISWINLGQGTVFNNLDAGNYYYEGTDINGCFIAGEASLVNPIPLTISSSFTPVTCFGDTSGSAILEISPMDEFVSVTWSNDVEELEITNLSTGIYDYTVIGLPDCSYPGTIEIPQPEEANGEIIAVQSPEEVCLHFYDLGFESEGLVPPLSTLWTIQTPGDDPYTIDNQEGITCFGAGLVELQLTDAAGCILLLNIELEYIVGTEELEANSILVYPNPSNGIFNISQQYNFYQAEIYSATSQFLGVVELSNNELDLSKFSAGLYILKLFAHQKIDSVRLVIE